MVVERGEKLGAYCGLAGVFLFGPALMVANFLPLPAASLSTEEVVQMYQGNAMGVRVAVIASL